MSSDSPTRAELVAALGRAMRVLSAQTVLYTQAIADRLGVNLTDLHCAAILSIMGPITAGRLAELTGLTTGAITGVVDRLERAGWARRTADPGDRRRVIIELLPDRLEREVGPLFAPMLRATTAVSAGYDEHDLSVMLDFVNRCTPVLREETARLRTEQAGATPPRRRGRRPVAVIRTDIDTAQGAP
jgi:hypothetical protein